MKRKFVMGLLLTMMLTPSVTSSAAPANDRGFPVNTLMEEVYFGGPERVDEGITAEPNLFEKEYIVIVDKTTMRSGPGYEYSAEGTLYRDDIVLVKSITSGWAKFRVGGKDRYVPASALAKVD